MANLPQENGLKVGKLGLGLVGLGASQAGAGDEVVDRGLRAEPGHFSMSSLSVPKINPIMPSLTLGGLSGGWKWSLWVAWDWQHQRQNLRSRPHSHNLHLNEAWARPKCDQVREALVNTTLYI